MAADLEPVRSGMTILRCEHCDTPLAPQTPKCSSCGSSELRSVCCSGAGSIVSWKVLPHAANGRHRDQEPVTLAIVELDDGPWVYSEIEGSFPDCADAPVRVELRSVCPAERFPVFEVCAA
ncbi:Zn-ribbon domain-containing OB-fold protein [Rhodococcus sp. O3]|uniref:Zn-ribbon domain-containing OB-fold protein n=1 Tax=Rhodococcus sp. O3 TaxID=3404919 RepID=UPI003B673EE4